MNGIDAFSNDSLWVRVHQHFLIVLERGTPKVKSAVIKRSIVFAGHKTSVSLEDAFWSGLKAIAHGRRMNVSHLIASIDAKRQHANLSSAIRLYVLDFYRPNDETGSENAPPDMLAVQSATAA
jgi:predicted DNA-binding ribbon-helix-helix protein